MGKEIDKMTKPCIKCKKHVTLGDNYDGEWLCDSCFNDKWSGVGVL